MIVLTYHSATLMWVFLLRAAFYTASKPFHVIPLVLASANDLIVAFE